MSVRSYTPYFITITFQLPTKVVQKFLSKRNQCNKGFLIIPSKITAACSIKRVWRAKYYGGGVK